MHFSGFCPETDIFWDLRAFTGWLCSPTHPSAETQRAGVPDTSGTDLGPLPQVKPREEEIQSLTVSHIRARKAPSPHSPPTPPVKASSHHRAGNPPLLSDAFTVPSIYDPICSCNNSLEGLLSRSPFVHMRNLGTES